MQHVSPIREPLVTGGKTYHDITEDVSRQVEAKPNIAGQSPCSYPCYSWEFLSILFTAPCGMV